MNKLQFQLGRLHELSAVEAEALFRLRQDVFVVEQDCAYPDMDGLDAKAWHFLMRLEGGLDDHPYDRGLIGCCRIFERGVFPPLHEGQVPDEGRSARIGRIAVMEAFRSRGYAAAMIRFAMAFIRQRDLGENIRMAAQKHLVAYYQGFGFQAIGEPYWEDGIEHQDVLLHSDQDLQT